MASGSKTAVIILSILGGVLVVSCGLCGTAGFFIWRGVEAQQKTGMCSNNVRQIMLGFLNHHDQRGDLPPLYIADAQGRPLHSWRVLLLPYIEQRNLFDQIHLDEPWDSEHNRQFHSQMPPIYVCPSSPHARESGLTSYFAVDDKDAALQPLTIEGRGDNAFRRYMSKTSLASAVDGASRTAFVIEATGYSVNWMQPADIKLDELKFSQGDGDKGLGSEHPNGIIFVGFGDGRAMAVNKDTSLEELRSMFLRNDGK